MRWVVGDIQGCAREFDELLRRIRFDPGRDELWSLGDLVNRGPDSLEVLRLWRDIGGFGILGNHDVYALLARSGRVPRRKRDTLGALFAAPDADVLLDRVRAMPLMVWLAGGQGVRDAWLVHAGLDPRWRDLRETARRLNRGEHDDEWLERPETAFATCVRCCTAEGERSPHNGPPATCPAPFRPWDTFYAGETLVIHGHWAARGSYRGTRTMGLDAGCVYGGKLVAWCQEEDRTVEVAKKG
jgi:bis(5'-nucleosyl)-tetraphosphatase (symmetrical)